MKFKVLPVDHNNLTDSRLRYANVIPIPRIFTPIFRPNHKAFEILYGSRFSAKSWTKAKQYLMKATEERYFRGVFARMTQKAARESQFQLFKDTLNRHPLLRQQFRIYESDMRIVNKRTGHFIKGGSFEQSDTLMSVPDITDFWAEEPISRKGKSLDRQSMEDIAGTLRNAEGVPVTFSMTFNPISKGSFIYQDFFDPVTRKYFDDEVHIIKANYYDNPWCPDDRVDYLKRLKRNNPSRWSVDGDGEWGVVLTGFEYYGQFNKGKHIRSRVIKNLPIHITFDFNVMPYMTAIINQVYRGEDGKVVFHAIKEYTLKPPRSTIEATCAAILRDWENHIREHGCFVYGDASGSNRLPVQQARTLYKTVMKSMKGYVSKRNMRISKSNRRHHSVPNGSMGRYELMMNLMCGETPARYAVDAECKHLVDDYENVLIGVNGGKAKKRVTEGGVSFEKYGHTSDAQDYFLCWQLKYQFKL